MVAVSITFETIDGDGFIIDYDGDGKNEFIT